MADALLSELDRALRRPAYVSPIYTRYCIRTDDLLVQILVLRKDESTMAVRADEQALAVDFRTDSVRDDVPGSRRPRPGFRISDELDKATRTGRCTILVNGNNVGYWGNQFAVHQAELVYKVRGPIFDDRHLARHVVGEHPFFSWTDDRGYVVENHRLDVHAVGPDESGVSILQPRSQRWPVRERWPATAVSGYPLLRDGAEEWFEARSRAWDPRLLFDTGRLAGVSQVDVQREIEERAARNDPLVRHALTAVGVDGTGDAFLLVAEQSRQRPRGLTVAEAAQLLGRLGAVDAVALGAAGDAQLATTDEGFLVAPLVDDYAKADARDLSFRHGSRYVVTGAARPVPCMMSVVARSPSGTLGSLWWSMRHPQWRARPGSLLGS